MREIFRIFWKRLETGGGNVLATVEVMLLVEIILAFALKAAGASPGVTALAMVGGLFLSPVVFVAIIIMVNIPLLYLAIVLKNYCLRKGIKPSGELKEFLESFGL